MSKYTNLYWFKNFKPDVVISTQDEGVASYVKKLILHSAVGKNGVFTDPEISKILEVETYYIAMGTKKKFINYLNKNCGFNINPYALNLEITLGDGKSYVFIETKQSHGSNLIAHCLQVQLYYNFRHHYLQGNGCRTPAEFTREFHDPIADEIIDFLKNKKI